MSEKPKQFNWRQYGYGVAGFVCDMQNDVTLFATPDHVSQGAPKRGTTWRSGASIFDGKFTISRFGRDEYGTQHKTAKDAMKAAEGIYLDETAQNAKEPRSP